MSNFSWRWTRERVAIEALKYTSRFEFQKGSHSAYLAAWRKGWMDEVCSHMSRNADSSDADFSKKI